MDPSVFEKTAPPRRALAIGASAGGIEATRTLVTELPSDIPAAIFIVVHLSPSHPSILPDILNRADGIPAAHGADNEMIRAGRIYVAPPDRHLLVSAGRIRVTRGPRENGVRPAVDPLFRTVAQTFGPGAVGVLLSGVLHDGVVGLQAIADAGGKTAVQSDARYAGMPTKALERVRVDQQAPVQELGKILGEMLSEDVPPRRSRTKGGALADAPAQATERLEELTELTCPECGGPIWRSQDQPLRFRCRVGHAYSSESFLAEQALSLERALWEALRSLEERARHLHSTADRMKKSNRLLAERFDRQAQTTAQRAELVRRALLDPRMVAAEGPVDGGGVDELEGDGASR